jgi:hypothetical protein
VTANRDLSPRITNLPGLVDRLGPDDRRRFDRIYRVSTADARMRVPPAMVPWVEQHFGPPEEVETQRIVRASNVVTGEGTLFNVLRARRPVRAALRMEDRLSNELADDVWANPDEATPEDLFGRLSNEHGVTAANVAKYDAVHSIIVFAEPNPLAFTLESIAGHMDLANRWLRKAHENDRAAVYPYVMWNCLWRAGGSIVHGHTQVSLARGRHYAKIERLRQDAAAYQAAHGARYFEELTAVHHALGLASSHGGVQVLAHLTPVKEKEVLLIAPSLDAGAAAALHDTLAVFRDSLGVQSFNVGMMLPPVTITEESWEDFPVVIRLVDRGELATRTSDIGGMEMFAESVVASDPFEIHEAIVQVKR